VPSLLAAIGEVIEQHLVVIGFIAAPEIASHHGDAELPEGTAARPCPRCGAASFVQVEGCGSCLSCGYSKCG
ncbi:MAG: hypothetical protein WCD42_06905, partial [Rhizomicrobium sp.]